MRKTRLACSRASILPAWNTPGVLKRTSITVYGDVLIKLFPGRLTAGTRSRKTSRASSSSSRSWTESTRRDARTRSARCCSERRSLAPRMKTRNRLNWKPRYNYRIKIFLISTFVLKKVGRQPSGWSHLTEVVVVSGSSNSGMLCSIFK